MIKNKTLYVKIIFKTYLKMIKNILESQTNFYSTKFQRIVFKNYF